MNPRSFWQVAPLLVLAACGPGYQVPAVEIAPRFREVVAEPSAESPPPVAPVEFWGAFGDTTLRGLIDQALDANRDLRVAEARLRGARAARLGATIDLAPNLLASAGYARQRLAASTIPGAVGELPEQDVWNSEVAASWELDLFGRNRRTLQAHRAFVGSAEAGLHEVQLLLVAEVASAYFELRGAQERLATAERNAENQRRTLTLTRERLEAGRGNALDSERAQAQLSSTLAVIPAIEGGAAAIQYRIGVLTGRPPAAPLASLPDEMATPSFPAAIAIARPDSLVRRRPDVRGAERRLAAQRALVGAATAEYLPRLTLVGAAGFTAPSVGALGDQGTTRYTVGPVLSWSVFGLGRVGAGRSGARAAEDVARAQYEQAVLRALADVETSLVVYRKARERLDHLDAAADASERAAELARTRYQEGAADFLQVLDAERTLLDSQDRRAAGRTEARTALIAVYRALGGDWEGNVPTN